MTEPELEVIVNKWQQEIVNKFPVEDLDRNSIPVFTSDLVELQKSYELFTQKLIVRYSSDNSFNLRQLSTFSLSVLVLINSILDSNNKGYEESLSVLQSFINTDNWFQKITRRLNKVIDLILCFVLKK